MKKILILGLLGFLTWFSAYPARGGEPFLAASIQITGYTNVNTFELVYRSLEKDEASSNFNLKLNNDKLSGLFKIPITSFRSKPEKVLDDFLVLADAAHYPYITIELLNEVGMETGCDHTVLPVTIRMAGCKNQYDIPVILKKTEGNQILLEGSQVIKLTDYGIDPPVKMIGLVRVENDLKINFSIIFTLNSPIAPLK